MACPTPERQALWLAFLEAATKESDSVTHAVLHAMQPMKQPASPLNDAHVRKLASRETAKFDDSRTSSLHAIFAAYQDGLDQVSGPNLSILFRDLLAVWHAYLPKQIDCLLQSTLASALATIHTALGKTEESKQIEEKLRQRISSSCELLIKVATSHAASIKSNTVVEHFLNRAGAVSTRRVNRNAFVESFLLTFANLCDLSAILSAATGGTVAV